MILYSLLLILTLFGVILGDYKKISKYKGLYIFIFIFASALAGAFIPIDGDCLQYLREFPRIPNLEHLSFSELNIGGKRQPFWIYFNSICKGLCDNFNFYLFIHSLLINAVFFYYISKHTEYKFTALLIFLTTMNFFYFDIEIQREALAVAVGLVIYKYLERKQYLYYYIGCVIAFLFHVSAIVLFLLPIIFYYFKYKYKKSFIILLVVLIVMLSSLSSFIGYFSDFEYTNGMVEQFDHYNQIEKKSVNLIVSAIFASLPIILFLIIARRIHYKNDMLINFAYLYLIIRICEPFVTDISRLNNYLYFPFLAFVATIIMAKKPSLNWRMLCIAALICIYIGVIYTWSRPMGQNNYQFRYYQCFVPYRSCFDEL